MLLLIIVLIVLFGGFGYSRGWQSGFPGGSYSYGGGFGLIIIVLIVLVLFGGLGGIHV